MALVATACGPPAAPADSGRYVAPTGVDTGTCASSASPCLTINYAVSQASAGERIRVKAGTYNELVSVTKSLTFEGANANKSAGAAPVARSAESIVKASARRGNHIPSQRPVSSA